MTQLPLLPRPLNLLCSCRSLHNQLNAYPETCMWLGLKVHWPMGAFLHPWIYSCNACTLKSSRCSNVSHLPAGCRAGLGFGSAQEQTCSQCNKGADYFPGLPGSQYWACRITSHCFPLSRFSCIHGFASANIWPGFHHYHQSQSPSRSFFG